MVKTGNLQKWLTFLIFWLRKNLFQIKESAIIKILMILEYLIYDMILYSVFKYFL